MPQPTAGDVHVNRPLTNISVAFIQDASHFVSDQIFPILPVDKQSDMYFLYDQAYWNSNDMRDRAPGTESDGSGYELTTDTYYAPVKAIHKDIADQIRANQDAPLNLDREATLWVTRKALIAREAQFASTFMTTGIWTRDYDGVASSPTTNQVLQWNDAASTPIEDVWDAKESILQTTGYEPNVLAIGYPVFKALKNHADIVSRITAGQTPGGPAVVTTNDLAQVFDVERVVVMRGVSNTGTEGATPSNSFIGGKKALLTYAPASPGLMTPTAGYTFTWTGYLGAGAAGQRIKTFRMEHLASDRVEIEIAFAMKLVSADMGAFWDTIVA